MQDIGVAAPATGLTQVWSRWRFWLATVLALVVAALLIGLLGDSPGRALDPSSVGSDGSRALSRVLAGYGVRLAATHDLAVDGGTVVVTAPDAFSTAQLRRLARRSTRLVLIKPGVQSTRAVLPSVQPDVSRSGLHEPSCGDAGASAAGPVDLPGDTVVYATTRGKRDDAVRCYGGALVVGARVTIVGSAEVFENQALGRRGVAALAVNVVSSDRTVRTVRWLSPGASADGSGQVSIWTLFPPGARRVALWLLLVGLVAVLWRARRLGPAVREPLPVVVRSVEIVEGHGRLYERAGARDRAAAALRSACAARLAVRLTLPRGAAPTELAAALAARLDRPAAEIWTLLAGPPPLDDADLARLARDLDRLEDATTRGPAR